MSVNQTIAELVKKVSGSLGYERGAICAVDCLLQADLGLLAATIKAWERHLSEKGNFHTVTIRHGAWVPAIPIE